jgi:hypothetical protein
MRRLARIECARLGQARARAGPVGGGGRAAVGFPVADQVARFVGAQVGKAAGERKRRERDERGEDCAACDELQRANLSRD